MTGRRELLDTVRAELTNRHGVLLHGPAGIGKSVLVAALMASSAAHLQPSGTVLHCSPAEADARLPFAGLVDLFARVPESCLATLAPEPQVALRAALLRGEQPIGDRDRLALRVAVLDVLGTLAATGPVLLVLDGLQWLDEPTAEVLAFAVRRVEGLDVRVVAAERVAEGEQPERPRCCPPGTVELPVPPLTDDEITQLLPTDLPPAVLRAVQDTAAGNPWYARELGQAAPRDGAAVGLGRPLPVPRRLRTLLLEQVRALPE
ncbi:ATP-binding protein, partial [Streptomyces prunicolor]